MIPRHIRTQQMNAMLDRIINNPDSPIRNTQNTATYKHPTSDLGVTYHTPEKIRTQGLTKEECTNMFGEAESVKMNFIPQMMNALAMQQASLLVNYCTEHRVKVVKRHTKVIRMAVEEYTDRLRKAYGEQAFAAYTHYAQRYADYTAVDLWRMEMQADTLGKNQFPDAKHYDIMVRLLVTVMLIRFCQEFDAKMDELIANRTKLPITHRKDIYQSMILAMCLSIAEDFGYRLTPDPNMGMWIRILSNKASTLAETIIEEEKQQAI